MTSSPSSFYNTNPSTIFQNSPAPVAFYTETAQFNLVYYGALSAPPTHDPFSQPVLTGAMYFDTGRDGLFVFDGTNWLPYAATASRLEFVIDGNGAAIIPGTMGYLEVPYDCTVVQWTLLGNVSGSIVVDVQRCTFAQFNPPTHPASGDSIAPSNKPTLASQISAQSASLGTWTTNLSQGDIIGITVTSATTVSRVTLSLKIVRR
jgi:hypothetical protein